MKEILSVVGARPNFIKVAPLDKAFEKYKDKVSHKIIHTGQHYDSIMSDAFFKDLDMPEPAFYLGIGSGSHAEQTARVMTEFEKTLLKYDFDMVIVVGDVNSTMAATITSVKLGVPVIHVEGGLRSFDRSMPEEINRVITDSICDYSFVTEQSAVDNLKKEGYPEDRIFHVGNVMIDSQYYAKDKAADSQILDDIGIKPREFALVTLHRPSNVDNENQLTMLFKALSELSLHRQVVFPVHPRTIKNMKQFGLYENIIRNDNIKLIEPVGFIDFLALMTAADFVITDSGGIQEETTALGVTCLTLRTTTERPITCEIGTNTLVLPEYENIKKEFDKIIAGNRKSGSVPELWDGRTSDRIADIIVNKLL